jgi:hypothetical protein
MSSIDLAKKWRELTMAASHISGIGCVAPFGFEMLTDFVSVLPRHIRRFYVYLKHKDETLDPRIVASHYMNGLYRALVEVSGELSQFVDDVFLPGDPSPETAIAAGRRTCAVIVIPRGSGCALHAYLDYLLCVPSAILKYSLFEQQEAAKSKLCRRYVSQLGLVWCDLAESIGCSVSPMLRNAALNVATRSYDFIPSFADWRLHFDEVIRPICEIVCQSPLCHDPVLLEVQAIDIHSGSGMRAVWPEAIIEKLRHQMVLRYCTFCSRTQAPKVL